MPTLPADAPLWLIVAALVAGWFGARVWPWLASTLSMRLAVTNDITRARVDAELAHKERELEALERHTAAEQHIAEAVVKLTELIQVNIQETRQNTHVLTSLSTAFSLQIGQMPTLRDVQHLHERLSVIEARLASSDPTQFGRRVSDAAVS